MKVKGWKKKMRNRVQWILKGRDIAKFIKTQRIRWLRHVERMEDNTMPKRMLKEEKEGPG
jgi:hypothetical protein